MSSGSQETRAKSLRELTRELRQFTGLAASYFRAAAARSGMTVTDMQVIDLLDVSGPLTAGQLADLTGLTTGAITGNLNRLEEAGLVRRERDPNDGRRVIVQLAQGNSDAHATQPILASLETAWDEMASRYTDEQVAFLLEFLAHGNSIAREKVVQLREAPGGDKGIQSTPLGNVERGRLVISSGNTRVTVRANVALAELYQVKFEGATPDVKVNDGVITIRYPRRTAQQGGKQPMAHIELNTTIPWQISIQGGATEIVTELGGLNLTGLEVKADASTIKASLPTPASVVPIRIQGAASQIVVRRPEGVGVSARLKGWVTAFTFDDQRFTNLSTDVRMQSRDYDATLPSFDIEASSSAGMVTIAHG